MVKSRSDNPPGFPSYQEVTMILGIAAQDIQVSEISPPRREHYFM